MSSAPPVQTQDPAVRDSRAFLEFLLADYHPRDFAVRFWDGSTWDPEPGEPARYSLVLQHPGAVRSMVYTCAYFHTPEDGIDTAQEQKLDHVCRKLRLRPVDRMLDWGCGWGALAIHAAQNYGAEVLGVTLSRPQVDLANERIRQA